MKRHDYPTDSEESEEDEDFYEKPSKSQKKRDAQALQDLGKRLTELADDQLKHIDLPEALSDAIADCKTMKSFGAIRRQLQYIGRLMRGLDAAMVQEAINRATGESKAAVAAQHRAEAIREALLSSDEAMTRYASEHPDAAIPRLRELVRSARKEAQMEKPPKSARLLYRMLYEKELAPIHLENEDPQ